MHYMSNEFPEWAEKEINSITNSSFIPQDNLEGTGYFLDIDKKNRKADIQFYEKLPTGKHIVTANIPKNIKIDELMKGFVYTYNLKILKASLSTKLSNYLKENLNIDMDYIYQFEVQSLEMLDVGGDLTSSSTEDDLED